MQQKAAELENSRQAYSEVQKQVGHALCAVVVMRRLWRLCAGNSIV